MGRLFESPEIFAQASDGRGRIKHNLRSVQTEDARAFGKMAVVANVNADVGKLRFEYGVSQIARFEVKLFPEARGAMRYVMLSVLPQVRSISVDNGSRVVVDALQFFLIDRHNDRHAVFPGSLSHQLNGRSVWNLLDHAIPACGLLGAKVRAGEDLLHAENLNFLCRGLFDEFEMFA